MTSASSAETIQLVVSSGNVDAKSVTEDDCGGVRGYGPHRRVIVSRRSLFSSFYLFYLIRRSLRYVAVRRCTRSIKYRGDGLDNCYYLFELRLRTNSRDLANHHLCNTIYEHRAGCFTIYVNVSTCKDSKVDNEFFEFIIIFFR